MHPEHVLRGRDDHFVHVPSPRACTYVRDMRACTCGPSLHTGPTGQLRGRLRPPCRACSEAAPSGAYCGRGHLLFGVICVYPTQDSCKIRPASSFSTDHGRAVQRGRECHARVRSRVAMDFLPKFSHCDKSPKISTSYYRRSEVTVIRFSTREA